ncbi:hypothetical protein [Sphingomonas bacterium]|uniref:hypothetical protein n=1 Tax=Sphingomonas bacterium TaxID=1895847 RepID=UPI001C2D677D|nr:hypothetical protein [Sphingomonas bacterium]
MPPQPGTALPLWHAGIAGDLAFETSAFLQGMAYAHPERAADQQAPDGAYGPLNRAWEAGRGDRWLIEEQRYAIDAVIAGIGHHRQDVVERGERIFDWGFAQERPDGSFDCPERFHSASFFVEAAAHAALLLRASDMAAANEAWVERVAPRLHQAARWMVAPANAAPGQAHDAPYTHRFYLDADALGETGLLTGDAALIAASRGYVERGLARQDPSGFNPEKGGSDTSYHAVGLLFAATYYTLVADAPLRAAMRPMADRGLAWLAARVRPDGTVDQTGNTRTGFGQERGPQGNLKTMSYGSAYRAFYYWGMIERDPRLAAEAALLHAGQQVENAQRKAAGA